MKKIYGISYLFSASNILILQLLDRNLDLDIIRLQASHCPSFVMETFAYLKYIINNIIKLILCYILNQCPSILVIKLFSIN